MMDNKINGHTEAFLKRQAKNIKKLEAVSYLVALDRAAVKAGFANWNHFKNLQRASLVASKNEEVNSASIPLQQICPAKKTL